jgi:hypothetical protein
MSSKPKALCLSILAIFAMSAAVASVASAAEFFDEEESPVTMTASAVNAQVFEFTNGKVECTKFSVASGGTLQAIEITVAPEYSECSLDQGGGKVYIAFVDPTKCQYKYTVETNANGHAEVHRPCGQEKIHIKITAFKLPCVTIEPTVGSVHYDNVLKGGKYTDIDATETSKNIKYTEEGTTCSDGTTHTTENGTLSGKITLSAHNGSGDKALIAYK